MCIIYICIQCLTKKIVFEREIPRKRRRIRSEKISLKTDEFHLEAQF
jgi:hypothetical protein